MTDSRSRRTIARDSVFKTERSIDSPKQGIESPEQTSRQTAVWLTDSELNWLDDQCQEIKRTGWRSVTRSALIRSIIRASMEKPVELGGVTSEAELSTRLVDNS